MCIRDRSTLVGKKAPLFKVDAVVNGNDIISDFSLDQFEGCLLYTSDAADERSSVDLGGRRIIKKKKT